MAKAKDKEQKKVVSLYLTTLRKIKPELTGKDLKSMGYTPGPFFKKILTACLEERLEGRIESREEEIDFVKKRFPVS
jgi:tRNA nucleotidyltransferase (CCA-adding enzyme)